MAIPIVADELGPKALSSELGEKMNAIKIATAYKHDIIR
jgi:hypothetical protein